MKGCQVRKFGMDPRWEIWMDGWSDNFDWTPAVGSRSNFVWKFWNDPQMVESEGFVLENVTVKRSVKQMEMCSGGPK